LFYDKQDKKFNVQVLESEEQYYYVLDLRINLASSYNIYQNIEITFVGPPQPGTRNIRFLDLPENGTFIFKTINKSYTIKYE
jgi:hypothetical protein